MLQIFYFFSLFNLLLVNITILLCFFFLFLVAFSSYFFRNRKYKAILALVISAGAPMTVVNDAIEMLQVVADKTINDLSK